MNVRFKENVNRCFHQLLGTNVAMKVVYSLADEK